MKLQIRLRLTGLCAILVACALSSTMRGATGSPPAASADKSAPAAAPALTRAEAQKIVAEARHFVAHPQPASANPSSQSVAASRAEPQVTTPAFDMAEPPPAPRAEIKPSAPSAALVWVAGHYMPVNGVWRWVNGEWATPATPISIWIPASYDAKEKKWSPGYWQPDVTTTPTAESTPKPAAPGSASP